MADFFDTTVAADKNLLHADVRTDAELDNVIDQVEWEIIDFYSQRTGLGVANYADFFRYENGADPDNEIKVRLVGYDQTTPTSSQADLKQALRRTIADVASWALRNYYVSQDVKSITQGKRSVEYSGTLSWRDFPDGWRRRLKNFDARFMNYGI